MSLVPGKQPEIRFDLAGPFGRQGVSFVPKIIFFRKDGISGTANEDFVQFPGGAFVAQAVIRCDEDLDGSGTATLGTDGNPDALIDTTDFDASSAGNWATNIGSGTAAGANGLYIAAADNIRLAIGGTPTVGAVSGFIVYYEMDSMEAQGVHFDL